MKGNYKPFIDRMISKYEGGYGWDHRDAGGPTKYGITCYDLAEHRHLAMTSMATWAPIVQAMPLAEAEAIYDAKYATGIFFDDLKSGIDVVMMDYAVNSGVARAVHVACSLVGYPSVSRMDAALLKKINATNPEKFIGAMCSERLAFMHAIDGGKAWVTFGKGWSARVADLRQYALLVANNAAAAATPAPDLTKVTTPKATNVAKTAPGKTVGGIVCGGIAANAAGLPWYGIVAVAGAILIAGLAYEAWHDQKTTAANLKVHA